MNANGATMTMRELRTITPGTRVNMGLREYVTIIGFLIVWTVGGAVYVERRLGSIERLAEAHDYRIVAVEKSQASIDGKIERIIDTLGVIQKDLAVMVERVKRSQP